ncbi:DNA replication and repair protein RecN [Colwellia chukchiensis]|uniref:DNA repair protein RecN n=1 Tax=Colwellia chukchiensis TaxID=641665 RepID=A0A1H7GVX5_9GAMM|nr:DNA repair protein RecN [Colwellia chukchiensis]SEK41647.1 DNA replication and repair protein RecN [Colwellia chukchiensis]
MLLQLNIQNFAIVRSLDIDWQQGMTTITGETGAGKSIAIDALGLCLGDRAVTNVVRADCKKAELAATFDTSHNIAAKNWLKHHDMLLDNECILRRVISAEGRSKAYINGSQVPLAQLKEIGQLLIHIHGQHNHQLIVKASEQRNILDAYANHQHLLDEVKYYYQQWRSLSQEAQTLQENKLQREAQQQLLQYQVQELNEFSLQPDEFENLEKDYQRQSNGQHILSETLSAVQQLSEAEQFNVVDSLRSSADKIAGLANYDGKLKAIAEQLNEALIQVEDASQELKHYYQSVELDPDSYSLIEERYSSAIMLAKKHQVAPNALAQFHQQLLQELALFSSDESRLIKINDDIESAKQQYQNAANILSESRAKAAAKLSKMITNSMAELNMAHGKFAIKVSQDKLDHLSLHGHDNVSFLASLNPGQPLEAMNKVASGGELSRISLAMQVILADKVITPSLIFDEVDVGISGPTAAMVGKKLQQLAKNTQVICVTHLPQVASKGHQQLFVAKLTDGEHTETTVTELSRDGRVQEIARLLAGDKVTDTSLANAQELLAG